MTVNLKKVLQLAETWSEEDQEELAQIALEIEARRRGVYHATDEELRAIDEGLAAVATHADLATRCRAGSHPGAQTVLMAGAGITGGQVIGSTDEFGYKAMEQPISYHDLHATMLHLLGLDHTRVTFRFGGRDMRLTDVKGHVIKEVIG